MSCVGGSSLITDRILYGHFHTFILCRKDGGAIYARVHWLVGGMLPWVHCYSIGIQSMESKVPNPTDCTPRSCCPLVSPDQRAEYPW